MIFISTAINEYLSSIKLSRSNNTFLTYRNAMNIFIAVLVKNGIDANKEIIENLSEEYVSLFAKELKDKAATTEQLYLTTLNGFYEYVVAENLADINLPKIRLLIKQRGRRPGKRLPQFPASDIDKVLQFFERKSIVDIKNTNLILRELRDKSFLITLADTGLRVHEACALRRGDIDWNEGKALIVGKGNKQAIVRFSRRAQRALQAYLHHRSRLDGISGRALTSLPLFARHDKGAGKKVKPITPTTGRNIVAERVEESLGKDAVGTITPHSFRHYFVTKVLLTTGNLKLAQSLARHQNIAVTQRYAHLADDELDRGYWSVFEE